MHGQRPKAGFGKGRRRKGRSASHSPPVELVRIAARRPNSPLLAKIPPRTIAASAVPQRKREPAANTTEKAETSEVRIPAEAPRRMARIVTLGNGIKDAKELERQKLLRRLMSSEGRGAISRAVNEFLQAGFALPDEQEVHLQLLEHFDESLARTSISAIQRLLDEEMPRKKPVLDQRLRRLEEHADEGLTRELAGELRRALRT